MKVYLNLAVPRDRRERYSLLWTIPVLILSVIVLAWMATAVIYGLRRSHQVQKSLVAIKARDAALRAREALLQRQIERPEFRQMMQKTEFINGLISQKQFSLTDLTFQVSKLLPPAARLNGLALASSAAQNPEVQFAVMGKNEEAIESFLANLEDSNEFSDVIIKSQGFQGGGGSAPQEVALVCTAKYLSPVSPSGN
jgi:hypothetical protein